ncbi:peptide ABC transporter substrate-binding protein [Celeribacter ethanolicus]|uniref:Peptide ABC transporter n=1 Tax=Celeribacter ethanolicus TaxID=1758178 RepID=A0A291GBR1_9RHOB|nr:peptide ABC transporter substrate-binding protein [Celeribacter ethanolicus]ATG47446.1 peptide ABC transporter [Celeribacter ethanolicus]TNE63022.1 MAG: peptide ABC transporter substrate-binding protein [Paracoccaceae bacterium]
MKIKTALKGTVLGAVTGLAMAPAAFAERGADGHVNIIYWQAPSTMNPYLSGGTKELEVGSLVLEPLARYDAEGNMVPFLAETVPTVENGGVSEDLMNVTWKLKPGLLWSDGKPLTSEDVRFTWEYCTSEGGGCSQSEKYNDVADVEIVDDLTVIVHFSVPKPFPYGPFVGNQAPIIQKAQFADCTGEAMASCTDQNFAPIGTGPFVVDEFKTNDVVSMSANPNYRDPNKPAFATATVKGGGDAAAAGRSVLETGEFDYAWNLQLSPEVLADMESKGKGKLVSAFGTLVERIMVNYTDPDPALGDERATAAHPHPILSDKAVRQALSMAIDRELLVEIGYGAAGKVTCNVLPAPAIYASTANDACMVQDIEGAKALLEADGWIMGSDGIREKDGKKLSLLFQSSTNAVRQDFQAIIKQWWNEIGVEVELRNIDSSVFFGGDAGSPDTFQKFFADVEMYANNFDGTDPEAYMANWECKQAPRPETQWQGNNMPRYCTEEYDALVAEMAKTGDLTKRAELAKAMNDMLMQDYAVIPLVYRGRVSAASNTLGGVEINAWDSELWNAADWYRIKE